MHLGAARERVRSVLGMDNGDYGEEIPIDLAGNPRRIDDPLAPDTGLGTAPIVDLGALERVPPP